MKTYTYSEARQRLASLLDRARREGRVQIRRQDGSTFLLQPVAADSSPLDVPAVKTKLRPGELTALVREERRRSADAIAAKIATKTGPRTKRPRAARRRPA